MLSTRSFAVQVDEEAKREAALPNDQPVSLQRVFLGGIPADVEQTSNRVNVPFQGCIWNLMVNAVYVTSPLYMHSEFCIFTETQSSKLAFSWTWNIVEQSTWSYSSPLRCTVCSGGHDHALAFLKNQYLNRVEKFKFFIYQMHNNDRQAVVGNENLKSQASSNNAH